MNTVVPPSFLFRFTFSVRKVDGIPKKGQSLLSLSEDCILPDVCELDGAQSFAQLRVAWNPEGLGISASITGKKQLPFCDTDGPTESDSLQVWVDTRCTQNVHRASRYCHRFCLLPIGAGKSKKQPFVKQLTIAQAREDAPEVDTSTIRLASRVSKTGYRLEAWFPSDVLNGYDPEANPSLGFFFIIRDAELGEQFLSTGKEFPVAHDPSLWAALELT
jgi:hypothetical protein